MKLSQNTLDVIKNFSTINTALFFKAGNVLRTVSPHKTILAEATIDETIPVDFGIHDLNQLLSIMSLHKDGPDMSVNGVDMVVMGYSDRSKISYRCCDSTMIKNPPEKNISVPTKDATFLLTEDDLTYVLKAASILGSPNISLFCDGSKMYLKTLDAQDDSAHVQTLEIGPTTVNGTFLFKTENWKMLPGTYDVVLSHKGVAHFQHKERKIQYWIALEQRTK